MYATSSEDTRVPWAAHSYNVAFSDEIGHFDYCYGVNAIPAGGDCPSGNKEGDGESADPAIDDQFCYPATDSTHYPIGGCFNSFGNAAFDGVPYQNDWPGTFANPFVDHKVHPTPIVFTSPRFGKPSFSGKYSRVAFETDLSRIEGYTYATPCDRLHTGNNCTDPPLSDDGNAAVFYPIFTTRGLGASCVWQEGGSHIPFTTNTFGGTSAAEYGPLLQLVYLNFGAPGTNTRYNDFRNVLNFNPCPG
jgi:hypothetical protein